MGRVACGRPPANTMMRKASWRSTGGSWSRHLPGMLITDYFTIGLDGSIWTAGSGGIHVVEPEAVATE